MENISHLEIREIKFCPFAISKQTFVGVKDFWAIKRCFLFDSIQFVLSYIKSNNVNTLECSEKQKQKTRNEPQRTCS